MKLNEYQERSKRTLETEGKERKELLCHMAMGLSGEAGEVLEHLKKHVFHGHELDMEALAYEIGDTMFYIANLCNVLNIPLQEVCGLNIAKLLKRYPEGFSAEKSINRENW